MGVALLDHLLRASVSSGVIILLLLLIRRIFRAHIPARLIYAAWLLVALRLLMPFHLQSPVSIFQLLKVDLTHTIEQPLRPSANPNSIFFTATGNRPHVDSSARAAAKAPEETAAVPQPNIRPGSPSPSAFLVAWLAGALVTAAYILTINVRFNRRVMLGQRSRLDTTQSLRLCALCQQLGIKPINVWVTQQVNSPCLIGTFKPYIALTPRSLQLDCFDYVLLHELAHYRQYDHLWALIRSLCLIVFWFHPLVWVAAYACRRDCELSCDERVLKDLTKQQHYAYANALIQLIHPRTQPLMVEAVHGATAMTEEKKMIKERIQRIIKRPRVLWTVSTSVILLLLFAGCVTLRGNQSFPDPSPTIPQAVTVPSTTTAPSPTPHVQKQLEKLSDYAAMIEALFPQTKFYTMNDTELAQAMDGLPAVIADNYEGIGRMIPSDGGYILLTSKPGGHRLPQTTITYTVSPAGTMLEQVHVEDASGNPICTLPLGIGFDYYGDTDIAVLYTGMPQDKALTAVIGRVLSGDQAYLDYLNDAHDRGVTVLTVPDAPYLEVYMMHEGTWRTEFIPLEQQDVSIITAQLATMNFAPYNPNEWAAGIGINLRTNQQNPDASYRLCQTSGGDIAVHDTVGKQIAIITPQLFKHVVDITRTKTYWLYVAQDSIHNIVKAELTIRFHWDQTLQTQVLDDPRQLSQLEALFQNAKSTDIGACPYTGMLDLTRADGEVIRVQIATDSCDSMILGTSVGYDYGPGIRTDGEGTENKQQVLINLFDQIRWGR